MSLLGNLGFQAFQCSKMPRFAKIPSAQPVSYAVKSGAVNGQFKKCRTKIIFSRKSICQQKVELGVSRVGQRKTQLRGRVLPLFSQLSPLEVWRICRALPEHVFNSVIWLCSEEGHNEPLFAWLSSPHHGETHQCISLPFVLSFIANIARKRPELNRDKTTRK